MRYFDLHCHPGLKTLFKPQDGSQISVWDNISTGFLGKTLGSQSSFQQIVAKKNINLICLTLHPPEKGMLNQFLLYLSSHTVFRNIIDYNRLLEICASTSLYSNILEQEFINISQLPPPNTDAGRNIKIKFLKKWSDYTENDYTTLHIIFNVEGGHTFYDLGNKVRNIDAVLETFDTFIAKGFKVLYFTPTHLTPNEFITHAYGNKILSKGQLLPKGIGITSFGKRLLQHVYNKNILIDIKHMSLVSRRIFYKWREINRIEKPLIASHIGLVGNSWTLATNDILSYKRKSYGYKVFWQRKEAVLPDTWFYPLSINLYNEDVEQIVKSKGLIGLSLDMRILGGAREVEPVDFLSHEEFELLSSDIADQHTSELAKQLDNDNLSNGNTMLDARNLEEEDIEQINDCIQELKDTFEESNAITYPVHYDEHLKLIVNHILRIFQVCEWTNAGDPSRNICIGSDFDGLIKPVDCCRNVTEFDSFSVALINLLKNTIPQYMPSRYRQINAEELVFGIMYGNAVNFLEKNL